MLALVDTRTLLTYKIGTAMGNRYNECGPLVNFLEKGIQ